MKKEKHRQHIERVRTYRRTVTVISALENKRSELLSELNTTNNQITKSKEDLERIRQELLIELIKKLTTNSLILNKDIWNSTEHIIETTSAEKLFFPMETAKVVKKETELPYDKVYCLLLSNKDKPVQASQTSVYTLDNQYFTPMGIFKKEEKKGVILLLLDHCDITLAAKVTMSKDSSQKEIVFRLMQENIISLLKKASVNTIFALSEKLDQYLLESKET